MDQFGKLLHCRRVETPAATNFVPAVPAQERTVRNDPADLLERSAVSSAPIADHVPVPVVDGFEMVDVDHHEGERLSDVPLDVILQ